MTAESIPCPACGEPVPFGRRTCEACGAYLTGDAAAARARAAAGAGGADEEAAEEAASSDEVMTEPATAAEPEPPSEAVEAIAAAGAEFRPPPAEPEAGPPSAEPGASGAPGEPFVPPVLRDWTAAAPLRESAFAVEVAAAEGAAVDAEARVAGAWLPPSSVHRAGAPPPVGAAAPGGTGAWPWSPPPATPEPGAPSVGPTDTPLTPAASEGAPSVAMPASLAEMLQPKAGGAPRWPGEAGEPGPSRSGARPAQASAPPARPGEASLLADLPLDAPDSLAGWLVVAGGGLASIGFFLPWVTVIGSYFDAWGFNTAAHLPVFLLVLATTALSTVSNRVAPWLRHGVLGLVVGGLLVGLTWNRLFGASGGQIGVFLEAIAAILLIVGGVLAVAPSRGGQERP